MRARCDLDTMQVVTLRVRLVPDLLPGKCQGHSECVLMQFRAAGQVNTILHFSSSVSAPHPAAAEASSS